MKLVRTTAGIMAARPFIFVFPAAVAFIYCVVDMYNPLTAILFGLGSLTGGNLSESVISFLQIVLDPAYLPLFAGAAAILVIIVTLVGAFLLGGYFNILNNALTGLPRTENEFLRGVRKYYSRMLRINLVILLTGLVLIVFLLVAAVPSVVLSRAVFTDRPGLMAAALFVDALTVMVLLFGFLFFSTYMAFWYPAAFNAAKQPFKLARRVVNSSFWRISGRFILFVLFLAAESFFLKSKSQSIAAFVADWLFKTGFFVLFATYLFGKFHSLTQEKRSGE